MHSFSASVNSGPPSESSREKVEDGRGQNRLIALTRGIAANDDRTVEARSEAAMLILVRLIDRRMLSQLTFILYLNWKEGVGCLRYLGP